VQETKHKNCQFRWVGDETHAAGIMFGGGELNASRYSSFFGGRIVIFGWYTWGAVAQVRRCNVKRYVQGGQWCRPHSFPIVILEDTRDICTRDVQLVELKGILNRTNHVASRIHHFYKLASRHGLHLRRCRSWLCLVNGHMFWFMSR
jgi:hypothetical protein